MNLKLLTLLPMVILLSGCGESVSERIARESRDAEEMQMFLNGLQEAQPRPMASPVGVDFEWQNRQRDLQLQQSRQRWDIYDAQGNRVGRVEPNYSPY